MSRITVFLVLSLLTTSFLYAQDISPATTQTAPKVQENEFKHLLSAQNVAHLLRKKYGIKGSVLLSKSLAQILYSFNNQQQAQNAWKNAIGQVKDNQLQASAEFINSQYHAGQILSKFTHGMNQKKWHTKRSNFKLSNKNIDKFFDIYDDLTIYYNLPQVWDVLLADIAKQENIQWQDVFANSLNLFSEQVPLTQTNKEEPNNNFFKDLKQWQSSSSRTTDLAELIKTYESSLQLTGFYQEVIRYELQKSKENLLSSAMVWLNIAEQLFLHKSQFSEGEITALIKYIEENDMWFLSKEQQLRAINTDLPTRVEYSFHNIKSIYSGAINLEKFELATIYQMLESKLDKYMTSPFRQKIRKDLEVCLNISEEFSPYPQEPIDKNQFEGCIKDMTSWAVSEASSRELSGSLTKVNSSSAIDRALELPNWQTINIIYANAAKADCLDDSQHLPNPFEWTIAAESLLWFADRWPAYMYNYPQNDSITKIIQQAKGLTKNLNCLEKSKQQTLDSSYNQVVQAWQDVKSKINQVATEFNQNNLATGSNLDLLDSSTKANNYRVAEMKIVACDVRTSCGVHVELESSKAIFALFPSHLLAATQLKQGTLKLCYDDIGWENRRATSTHLDNDNVANYYGNFSFSLKGYYNDELVFARKLVDKQEYRYLFGANTPEVLATACPLPIVGQKISTQLKRGTFGLVPNRLTFLTASRTDESRILEGNWTKGDEWNDVIVGDSVSLVTENIMSEVKANTQQVYQLKADQLQATIYKSMLGKLDEASEIQQQLAESFNTMQRNAKLFASMNFILQMNNLMLNDDLHGMFYGSNKIPDDISMHEFFNNQLNINSLIENIDNNLQVNQEKWNALTITWSNPHINDILFRLDSLIE